MKIKSKAQAEIVKSEAVKIAAETMQTEFEDIFKDEPEAFFKFQQVMSNLSEENQATVLLQDNRLYLYEILMDNSVEDIVKDINTLIKNA